MEVFNELWSIMIHLSSGPDDISARFFKETSFILSDIINFLFNKSLQTGVFHDKWKTSYVTQIFKKGDRSQVSNYRPISKISILPKLFSKLVNNQIFPLCEKIICNKQHGFRPKHSSVTNLCIFKQTILNAFNDKVQLDVVYTYFEKAFDHQLLIKKN